MIVGSVSSMRTNDLRELNGRAAIVTGGASGLGAGIALSLGRAGADVVVLDIDHVSSTKTIERLREHGVRAESIAVDAMDSDALSRAVTIACGIFDRVDILVNNVGGTSRRPVLTQSATSVKRHIDLNLMSMLTATSAVVPLMQATGRGGSIINVSSIEAERAAPGFAVYAACKAAVNSLTRTMALEFAEARIRVNAIAPDHTATPGTRGGLDPLPPLSPRQVDAMAALIPLGREGVSAECGEVVAFLASDRASYVTGIILPVDGGTSAAGGWHRGPDSDWQVIDGYRFD